MGKRLNKTTKFVVDVSQALHANGLPTTLRLELSLRVKHSKNLANLVGHYNKPVIVDFTKVKANEAVSS